MFLLFRKFRKIGFEYQWIASRIIIGFKNQWNTSRDLACRGQSQVFGLKYQGTILTFAFELSYHSSLNYSRRNIKNSLKNGRTSKPKRPYQVVQAKKAFN